MNEKCMFVSTESLSVLTMEMLAQNRTVIAVF